MFLFCVRAILHNLNPSYPAVEIGSCPYLGLYMKQGREREREEEGGRERERERERARERERNVGGVKRSRPSP